MKKDGKHGPIVCGRPPGRRLEDGEVREQPRVPDPRLGPEYVGVVPKGTRDLCPPVGHAGVAEVADRVLGLPDQRRRLFGAGGDAGPETLHRRLGHILDVPVHVHLVDVPDPQQVQCRLHVLSPDEHQHGDARHAGPDVGGAARSPEQHAAFTFHRHMIQTHHS